MPAPTGEEFTVDGVVYTVRPRASSENNIKAIKRLIKRHRREEAMEALHHLEEVKDSLDKDTVSAIRSKLTEQFSNSNTVTEDDAWNEMSTTDGMAVTILNCCDEISSFEQAKKIVEQFAVENGTHYQLVNVILAATGIEEAKN